MSLDPTKLKVAELKEELIARNLDSKGLKAALVKRLQSAIAAEQSQDFSVSDGADENNLNDSGCQDNDTSKIEKPEEFMPVISNIKSNDEATLGSMKSQTDCGVIKSDVVDEVGVGDSVADSVAESATSNSDSAVESEIQVKTDNNTTFLTSDMDTQMASIADISKPIENAPQSLGDDELLVMNTTDTASTSPSCVEPDENVPKNADCAVEKSTVTDSDCATDLNDGVCQADADATDTPQPLSAVAVKSEQLDAGPTAAHDSHQQLADMKPEQTADNQSGVSDDTRQSPSEAEMAAERVDETSPQEEKVEIKKEGTSEEAVKVLADERPHGVKRSLSPETREAKKANLTYESSNEPHFDDSKVVLDWYNSDLSLIIDPDTRVSAKPLSQEGFGYMWSGARATYGFTSGKVYFEVKITDHNEVRHLSDEPNPHVVRVGWSTNNTSMQLGEEACSYGYGGTAKFSSNLKFSDYGCKFSKNDVVGAYADLSGDPVRLHFTVNGEYQGEACVIPRSELGEQEESALFPHILTKNSCFTVNMGQLENPWFQHPPELSDYVPCELIPSDHKVHGSYGPKSKSECTIIMMIGLPGCGKTTWVDSFIKKHASEKFNVLGTNFLIDRMKVMGLPRRKNYRGRWEQLISSCTRCLNMLLEMAHKRHRNFIIDQTNVYRSAQRRKMRNFSSFKRKAVVIVPPHEEYRRRVAECSTDDSKEVPESALMEMKAAFQLPLTGEYLDEVEYIELDREEALKVIQQYAKEASDSGVLPPWEKRKQRDNQRSLMGNYSGAQRSPGHMNSFNKSRQLSRDQRGNYQRSYGSGSGWNNYSQGSSDRRGGGWWSGGAQPFNGAGGGGYSGGGNNSARWSTTPQPWATAPYQQTQQQQYGRVWNQQPWSSYGQSNYAGQSQHNYSSYGAHCYGDGVGSHRAPSSAYSQQRSSSGYNSGNYSRNSGHYRQSGYGYNRR